NPGVFYPDGTFTCDYGPSSAHGICGNEGQVQLVPVHSQRLQELGLPADIGSLSDQAPSAATKPPEQHIAQPTPPATPAPAPAAEAPPSFPSIDQLVSSSMRGDGKMVIDLSKLEDVIGQIGRHPTGIAGYEGVEDQYFAIPSPGTIPGITY